MIITGFKYTALKKKKKIKFYILRHFITKSFAITGSGFGLNGGPVWTFTLASRQTRCLRGHPQAVTEFLLIALAGTMAGNRSKSSSKATVSVTCAVRAWRFNCSINFLASRDVSSIPLTVTYEFVLVWCLTRVVVTGFWGSESFGSFY